MCVCVSVVAVCGCCLVCAFDCLSLCACVWNCMCVCVCVLIHRGWGALPEAGADYHRHLRGLAGGRHHLRGGLLQNQVRLNDFSLQVVKPPAMAAAKLENVNVKCLFFPVFKDRERNRRHSNCRLKIKTTWMKLNQSDSRAFFAFQNKSFLLMFRLTKSIFAFSIRNVKMSFDVRQQSLFTIMSLLCSSIITKKWRHFFFFFFKVSEQSS